MQTLREALMSGRYVGSGIQAPSPAATLRVSVRAEGHVWVSVRSHVIQEHCLGVVPGLWSTVNVRKEGLSVTGAFSLYRKDARFVHGWDLMVLRAVRKIEGNRTISNCFSSVFLFCKIDKMSVSCWKRKTCLFRSA